MPTDKHGASFHSLTACATGCEPLEARLTTWTNRSEEFNPGCAAQLRFQTTPVALRFGEPDGALEALAAQLEVMAAKVRALKGGR
jgi:hypothetical protein